MTFVIKNQNVYLKKNTIITSIINKISRLSSYRKVIKTLRLKNKVK